MPDFSFREDLLKDPKERDILYRYARAEVSGQNRNTFKAFMEAATNRADAEGKTLTELFTGTEGAHKGQGYKGYYPSITHSRAMVPIDPKHKEYYDSIAEEVKAGSNIANYATGNASGSVGFEGGPNTAKHDKERFGIEGWTAGWARKQGYTGDLPIQTSTGGGPGPPDSDQHERAGLPSETIGPTSVAKAAYRGNGSAARPKLDKSLASAQPSFISEAPSYTASDVEAFPIPMAPTFRMGRLKVPDYG